MIRVGPRGLAIKACIVWPTVLMRQHSSSVTTSSYTIQHEHLVLGELSHRLSGLNASFAAQGGDNGFRENTLVLGYAIP
jgi:hypothetical protein